MLPLILLEVGRVMSLLVGVGFTAFFPAGELCAGLSADFWDSDDLVDLGTDAGVVTEVFVTVKTEHFCYITKMYIYKYN